MRLTTILAALGAVVPCLGSQIQLVDGISQNTYDELVQYTKYSSAAYQMICPRPLGNKLVGSFSNLLTSTRGYVALDDERKEIVVAFRGSQQIADFLTDGNLLLIPFTSPGVTLNSTDLAEAHAGFLIAYNSVSRSVVSTVRAQLEVHPDYSIVSTGHSLGGALASIGSVSLKSHFPSTRVRLFTFGQPRTGNFAYADLVESMVGVANLYRGVHTWDGVPTMVDEALGYRHHGTEYWQFKEPPNRSTTRSCSGQEDPICSRSILSTGVNLAHGLYFGQVMTMDATLCL